MAIQQLIYHSTATRALDAAELDQLVAQARIHNDQQNISGVLFSAQERYFQVLEGEPRAVRRLYAHISADPRHTQLVTVLDATVSQRLFPDWQMGFSHVSPTALARLAAYLDPQHRTVLVPSTYDAREVIRDLLQEFIQEETSISSGK
ncbi:MAG TPA: BLUF domain-containing protein [Hymenobacter sp.]|jgi:hypothetical protein|uniref:BLUF domain-containing protein n=1 Tax=Hymenobacter sp. TaxID=1898978 RepID=UPI002ED90341